MDHNNGIHFKYNRRKRHTVALPSTTCCSPKSLLMGTINVHLWWRNPSNLSFPTSSMNTRLYHLAISITISLSPCEQRAWCFSSNLPHPLTQRVIPKSNLVPHFPLPIGYFPRLIRAKLVLSHAHH